MPLNQREQKRAILHVRARTYEDVARELRSMSRTGFDLGADVQRACDTFERRARELRADADSTLYSSVDDTTVNDMLRRFTIKLD